uniref:Uncharacterized protein n=1 Tax=Glossina morsitans morsitans TaxID=37546 RepID=A0A1B0FC72_GLOMM
MKRSVSDGLGSEFFGGPDLFCSGCFASFAPCFGGNRAVAALIGFFITNLISPIRCAELLLMLTLVGIPHCFNISWSNISSSVLIGLLLRTDCVLYGMRVAPIAGRLGFWTLRGFLSLCRILHVLIWDFVLVSNSPYLLADGVLVSGVSCSIQRYDYVCTRFVEKKNNATPDRDCIFYILFDEVGVRHHWVGAEHHVERDQQATYSTYEYRPVLLRRQHPNMSGLAIILPASHLSLVNLRAIYSTILQSLRLQGMDRQSFSLPSKKAFNQGCHPIVERSVPQMTTFDAGVVRLVDGPIDTNNKDKLNKLLLGSYPIYKDQ